MNVVALSGNLTRDPELKMAGSTPICKFTLAVSERKWQDEQWVDVPSFFHVDVFRGAEWLSNNLTKGMRVSLVGRLEQRTYEKDDERREAISILASEVVTMQNTSKPSQGDAKKVDVQTTSSAYGYTPQAKTATADPVCYDTGLPF